MIINMDQTAVFFSMQKLHTLESAGSQTVNVCSMEGDGMWATVALAITTDGTFLPPFIIFKGKEMQFYNKKITFY